MKELTIVQQCYHGCPFFALEGPMMYCDHPHWNDKGPYAGVIITQRNSHNRVPDECPLREKPTVITVTVRLIT
jgi:hypothetical protein